MKLNYKVFGEGKTIIILHGLLGSLDNWVTIAKKLSDHYKVFVIDQRNHGKSPHAEEHNFEAMSEDLAEFYNEHGVDKAILIGHSMGGKTAMQFAIDHPDKVEKMIVVDIGTKGYARGHDEIFDALLSSDPGKIENRGEADEKLKPKIPDFAVRQFLLKNLERRDDGSGYEWKMNLPVLYREYDNITEPLHTKNSVDLPVLFMKGSNSPYIGEEDLPEIRRIFPDSRLQTVEGAGHWVHAEAPDAFLELARNFIEELS